MPDSNKAMKEALTRLMEAADALLANEEHAESGGMRTYQKGSPTWKLWRELRAATVSAADVLASPPHPLTEHYT